MHTNISLSVLIQAIMFPLICMTWCAIYSVSDKLVYFELSQCCDKTKIFMYNFE